MNKKPTKLVLETLEDRTCPTLILSVRNGGLFLSGVPTNSILTITQTTPNRLDVMDGTIDLGSYTVPGGLSLNLARYNQGVNVDVGSLTYNGNVFVNVGLGGMGLVGSSSVTIGSTTGGGAVAGNLTLFGGSGQETWNIGDPTGNSITFAVGGSVTATVPARTNSSDELNLDDGTTVGENLTSTNIAIPSIGAFATGDDTVGGNVTLTNAVGGTLFAAVNGTVGKNVSVSGGLLDTNLSLGEPIAGSTTLVGGNLSVNFGSGTNSLEMDGSATVQGNVNYSSNAGTDIVTLNGAVFGNSNVNLGAGASAVSMTNTVNGDVSVTGGDGSDTAMLAGVVGGNTTVQLGNGLDTATLSGSYGGTVGVTLGNGGDSVNFNAAASELNVLLGNGDDSLTLGAATVLGRAYLDGGNGTNMLDTSALTINFPVTIKNFS